MAAWVDTPSVQETDRSCLATSPAILVSSSKAFDLLLCSPRVSGIGGRAPCRPSGGPRECARILTRMEVGSDGGCTSYTQRLEAPAIHDLLASEQVVWTFFSRVGDCTGLLQVTVESISGGERGIRHWMGKQGAAVVVVTEECTNDEDLE